MREASLAVGILGGLALFAALTRLPFVDALAVGVWLVAVGLAIGLPAGIVYHVLLRRALVRAGGVPRGWVWRPTAHHADLDDADRRRVVPSFLIGAVACGAVFFGCALLFVAALIELQVLPG